MSQRPAMQYRAPTANGSGRRRTDKDLGNRSDKTAYPTRSGYDNPANAVGYHGPYNHLNSENISPADNSRLLWEGTVNGSRGRVPERTLNDRLLLITMLLIGQPVEVQVKNGSIYSGIFHTANIEKDYGVVLKMARLTKDGSAKGGAKDMFKDLARRAPMKTLIILAKDLVQVIAKDIPLTGDEMGNGRARENKHEIVTDSFLAQAHPIEVERELKPWTPDKDAPGNVDLENTFQNTQNRYWDQFETNKSLFGVESTFNEELYTTKLERGPQTKDLERKASIIAKEIEAAATGNFHLAEERGIHFGNEEESFDEESRFSSVLRREDIGEDNEDKCIDDRNEETFGIPCTKDVPSFSIETKGSTSFAGEPDNKASQTIQTPLADSSVVRVSPHHVGSDTAFTSSNVSDQSTTQPLHSDSTNSQVKNVNRDLNDLNLHENAKSSTQQLENQANCHTSFAECTADKPKELEVCPSDVSSAGRTSPLPSTPLGALSAMSCEPADVESSRPASSKGPSSSQPVSVQEQLTLTSRAGKSGSLASELPTSSSASSSALMSSPDPSRVASLRKPALNPNAKEFKLNPNAKSYTPCFSTPRPASPVVQGSVYVSGSNPPLTPIQSLPAGLGVSSLAQQASQPAKFAQYNNAVTAAGVSAASYIQPIATFVPRVSGTAVPAALTAQQAVKIPPPGQQVMGHSFSTQQPIRYTSQAAPLHQAPAYLHPNAQMYSQQMVFGQPGQVVYIQPYPNEMMQGPQVNPPQGSVPPQAASHQAQQQKHRGTAVHGMQYCVAAPFVSGQHPYIQSAPVSHLPNTIQPSPGVLVQPSVPGIQIPQGIVAGLGPTAQNGTGLTGSSGIWVGGKGTAGNFQQ